MHRISPWLVIVGLVLSSPAAFGRKPEDVFAGKILISDKPFPTGARSPQAYVGALKKQNRKSVWEDKKNKQWRVYYAAFFRKPLNDLEVTIKFYDISDGSRRMVETYEQYLSGRGQRAMVGDVKLRHADGAYEANSRIWMVMENRGRVIAQATFDIGGEGRKYSGKVTFTEEEANGNEEIKDDKRKGGD